MKTTVVARVPMMLLMMWLSACGLQIKPELAQVDLGVNQNSDQEATFYSQEDENLEGLIEYRWTFKDENNKELDPKIGFLPKEDMIPSTVSYDLDNGGKFEVSGPIKAPVVTYLSGNPVQEITACLEIRDRSGLLYVEKDCKTVVFKIGESGTVTISGKVAGLPQNKDLEIQVNGETHTLGQNGDFTLNQVLDLGDNYDTTVVSSPSAYIQCSITNASGSNVQSDVDDILIDCTCSGMSMSQYDDAGSGTAADPYLIANAAQLEHLAQQPDSNASAHNAAYKLVCDLDYSGMAPTPIGSSSMQFRGEFDGDGFAIANYSSMASDPQTSHAKGIFAKAVNATIKNLRLSNISMVAGSSTSNMGALVGWSKGTLYENIEVDGVTLDEGARCLGAIGGLIGYLSNNSGADGVVSKINAQNIIIDAATSDNGGGLVGHLSGKVELAQVTGLTLNCDERCGGLVGNNSNLGVSKSAIYASSVEGRTVVGGAIGKNGGQGLDQILVGMVDVQSRNSGYAATGGLMGNQNANASDSVVIADLFTAGTSAIGAVYGADNSGTRSGISYHADATVRTCQNCSSQTGVAMQTNINEFFAMSDAAMTNWDTTNVWCPGDGGLPKLRSVPSSDCE